MLGTKPGIWVGEWDVQGVCIWRPEFSKLVYHSKVASD